MPFPVVYDNKPWPIRLEPHESVTTYFSDNVFKEPLLPEMRKAYAKTSCGYAKHGKSPALTNLIKMLSKK